MPAIICSTLHKTYRHGFWRLQRKKALVDLSLSIATGEVFGIIGPNGAGKSTALKILMGLVRPTSGCAEIMGLASSNPACHRHIGYLPENPSLYQKLSITDHLVFVGKLARMENSAIRTRIAELLHLVDLEQSARTPIHRFSKGMVQRAALAYQPVEE
ncbi:MAG: ABC transporter ATP-binding protein [Desulfobulbaceae bacterium]|nr:ABC transporter ATP-binding protein [Desulfobulbaceae bacterium]